MTKPDVFKLIPGDGTYYIHNNRLELSAMPDGYWVAESDHNVSNLKTYEELVEFAKWVEDKYDVAHVGIWTDDNGTPKLDATHHVHDLLQAVAMGRHWDQKAIWDIKHGHAIYIN